MIIKTSQLQKFSEVRFEEFRKKTIVFLRRNFAEWANGKDDTELRKYINSMIEFGKKYKVFKEINLQKLMHYHIHYQFDIPLRKNQEKLLTENKLTEKNRIENFHRWLRTEVAI
jgi:hypothetical protein